MSVTRSWWATGFAGDVSQSAVSNVTNLDGINVSALLPKSFDLGPEFFHFKPKQVHLASWYRIERTDGADDLSKIPAG